jgi:hypothetical protein
MSSTDVAEFDAEPWQNLRFALRALDKTWAFVPRAKQPNLVGAPVVSLALWAKRSPSWAVVNSSGTLAYRGISRLS